MATTRSLESVLLVHFLLKEKESEEEKKSRKRRKSFANTGLETSLNHIESGPPVEETSIQPVFPEDGDIDANASTDQVVVAVPVVTQISFQKKKGLFGRSLLTLTCPTSLSMTTITRMNS